MSSGDLCKSCKQGNLRPFQLSATEAIIKCSNTDCDSYLDFLPQETVIVTGPASTPSSYCSSRAVSRCVSPDSPALSQYSSTDLEVAYLNKPHIQATNSREQQSHVPATFAPSKFPSSCRAPKSAFPSIAKSASHLTDAERCNIDLSTASPDELDLFLDSLVGDNSSPKLSLPNSNLARGLPSHFSAFSQVPSVSQQQESVSIESVTKNDFTHFDEKKIPNKVESVYDKLSEVCKSGIALGFLRGPSSGVHESAMLDENQFLSPSGSVVSEDSGYNDEIATAVAVSGAGTRGGQAETKTTNSSMPATVTQLARDTVTAGITHTSSVASSHTNKQHALGAECVALSSAAVSPANTPFEAHSPEPGSDPSPVHSSKSTDSSTNPDTIPLPAALLLPESLQNSQYLSNSQLKPSCSQSTEEVVRNDETNSQTILSYAQLSLTNFLSIFEQNLVTAISKDASRGKTHQKHSSGSINSNKRVDVPNNFSVEVPGQISGGLSEQSGSSGESSTLTAEEHSSDGLTASQLQNLYRGRPAKKKYKKRAPKISDTVQNETVDNVLSMQQKVVEANSPNPLFNNNVLPTAALESSDATQTVIPDVPVASIVVPAADEEPSSDSRIPSVLSSDAAREMRKRRYTSKRKIQEEYPAPRKSARHQVNPVESSRDTSLVRSSHAAESQAESSSSVVLPPATLAHVRPSLAALLPPLPPHLGHKHRCDGGRSNKRLKPSQPFRHLANAVGRE